MDTALRCVLHREISKAIGENYDFGSGAFKGDGIEPMPQIIQFGRGMYAMQNARYAIARPSVRLSHGWISPKRLMLGSYNFHHRAAQSL